MKVLGVDPGLNITGYGLIQFEGNQIRLLEAGIIKPKRTDLFQNRVNKIYTLLGEVITQHSPDVMVLEKLYSHSKYPITSSILGHARGVICLLSAQKNITLVEQSVKRIRKAVLGNGNASKQQTRSFVAQILKIDESKLTLDTSDALALTLGYVHIHGRKL